LQPNESLGRNQPFVILRGDRPLHPQKQPLNSDVLHEVPCDFYPPKLPDLRDPEGASGEGNRGCVDDSSVHTEVSCGSDHQLLQLLMANQ
jgi:hypothetical protein